MIKMNKPKAVIFDFGGTILYSDIWDDINGNREILKLAKSNIFNYNEFDIQNRAKQLADFYNAARNTTTLEIPIASFQRTLYDGMNITFDNNWEELELSFYKNATNYKTTHGIKKLLNHFETKNIRMGILSNFMFSSKTISHDLEKFGIKSYFDFVITSSEYGIRKPNKLLFEIAIKKMNLKPDEIWFVGDSINEDIIGSRNAGMFPVWYNIKSIGDKNETGCLEINSWDKLKRIVE